MSTCHIDTCNTPMGERVIPCPHSMMSPNGRIEKLCHIASGVDARNVGLQILINYDAAMHLNRCPLQKLRVQRDPQTNPKHIDLYLTAFLRLHIARYTIL